MYLWKENIEYKKTYLNNIITHSCDICHKQSSINNRTCNNCFYKLIGKNNEM
ncbi:hypothetical protein [Spiroplasma endosymbiont of Nebria brevicollis]|uniref:hypothetical protein n=1 Tax=Spiroplasma endosymbiont of Nebria brevicollis TaxID=3066284 RepID=UPI00313BC433